MALNNDRKKQLRGIGHALSPVITVGNNGLSDALYAELERALEDHELIKVRFQSDNRDMRRLLATKLCAHSNAELVQTIGKVALIFRAAKKPNPRLSNLLRKPS